MQIKSLNVTLIQKNKTRKCGLPSIFCIAFMWKMMNDQKFCGIWVDWVMLSQDILNEQNIFTIKNHMKWLLPKRF